MSGSAHAIRARDKKILRLIKVQILLLLLVVAGVGYYYVSGYASIVSDLKSEAVGIVRRSSPETFRQIETSEVYAANGDTISVLKGEKDVYYISFEQIPTYVTQAIISIEDKKFYQHDGVDYKAIARALIAVLRDKEITQGGSTITQQLARTIFLSSEKTWQRKVEEIYIASEMEKKYSKDQILEFYLNNVYFANGYYGIQAAAKGYFSKDISELTLSEICYLLAIPNSPTYYDPIVNPENTLTRRNLILNSMYSDGVIGESTYNKARQEQIILSRTNGTKNNYVETYIYYCATRALMEVNGFEFQNDFKTTQSRENYEAVYDEMYNTWNKSLFTSGYRIYTSINIDMQQQLQEVIDTELEEFTDVNEEGIYALQGAAVTIDNKTGMAVAIVGGRSQDVSGYTLNRAYQSFRQPGSSIKPLLVYTPVLERGYTPDTIVIDEEIEDGPENAGGTYAGEITLREAVAKSKNTIAWKLYEELTPQVGIQYLKKLGFSHIEKDDYGMAACLGGLTVGVSPLEMAKGYATIFNDGYMRNPSCILKITDAKGNIIYEKDEEEVEVYKENAARTMTDMLQSVVTDGTAKGINLSEMPVAGKTGTTNSNRDGWFVGYSYYYTTSVWVGYDLPKQVPGLKGSTYPAKIWQDYMAKIHEGLQPIGFKRPVEFIGTEEQMEEPEFDENEFSEFDEEEPYGVFDEEHPGEDQQEEADQPSYRIITQTFEGTEVPEGSIPDNATDIEITTVTE
ncbi:transglycosylase domain-containing protein [Pseudobutyrivibrio xylanivorans]|uniref:Penicillin-binding protein 1A n=1 Tax=Pseudobutyrivibrio xylanivorans TaxID=185007 RepID=A0A5P6VVH8_PSEXY|nr:PBP1A family penicillin-binding protein [Pseudobutyrivibrio xylanivorans]QFJ55061.1 glycosyl transferase family 51 [Pseudobutyrivibrio xylanivorans]